MKSKVEHYSSEALMSQSPWKSALLWRLRLALSECERFLSRSAAYSMESCIRLSVLDLLLEFH